MSKIDKTKFWVEDVLRLIMKNQLEIDLIISELFHGMELDDEEDFTAEKALDFFA